MAGDPTQLVQKLCNNCNILRDDGLSYGDYVEQLTFLLFLKMADERSFPGLCPGLVYHSPVGLSPCQRLPVGVSGLR